MERIRRRLTFFVDFKDNSIASQFQVSEGGDRIEVLDNKSPRHVRVVIPDGQQDDELRNILRSSKVQISWSRPQVYDRAVPFKTPREPGLHVEASTDTQWESVLELLILLGFDPATAQPVITDNWISLYFETLPEVWSDPSQLAGIHPFLSYIDTDCDSFTLSYGKQPLDPLPNQLPTDLVLETYTSKPRQPVVIEKVAFTPDEKVEVGILSASPPDKSGWMLSGLVRDLDKPATPPFEKVIVHYASKHISVPSAAISADFQRPVGLHPKHVLELNSGAVTPPEDNCRLYAKYSIPKWLFLDQYQLADLDRTTATSPATGKLVALWGETDLEAPVWSVDGWGSEALVEIYPPHEPADMSFDLPMHSRYEVPQNHTTSVDRTVPWPLVFWVCQDIDGQPSPDTRGIGYESLFPEDSIFYYADPNGTELMTHFSIPVAPLEHYSEIQWLSMLVLVTGTLFLVYKVFVNAFKAKRD